MKLLMAPGKSWRVGSLFGAMVALALFLSSSNASPNEANFRLREIFVPQTSEFTQRHPGGIASFDLSPDGEMLAVEFGTQESDKTNAVWVALWDVHSQRLIESTQVDRDIPFLMWYGVPSVRFSPDGHTLIVLTGPRLVALSVPELKILYSFEDRVLPANAKNQMFIKAFSVAADRLAVLREYDEHADHWELEVKVADLHSGKVFAHWSKPGLSYGVALSPDANLLALTMCVGPWGVRKLPPGANNVLVLSTKSGEVIRAFNSGFAAGNSEFVGGSDELLTMPINADFGPDDAAMLWNLKTGQLERKLGYPKYGLRGGISLSANGELLAVAAFWLNPTDVRLDRDNPRGGARLLLWTLQDGKLVYASDKLDQEYNRTGAPMSVSYWPDMPPVTVRTSASGHRVAFGGQVISVDAVEGDSTSPLR